jgi:hypothetical protein
MGCLRTTTTPGLGGGGEQAESTVGKTKDNNQGKTTTLTFLTFHSKIT